MIILIASPFWWGFFFSSLFTATEYCLLHSVLFAPKPTAYISNMNVYSAIDKMREISNRGGEFSFSFMSFSETTGKSEGICDVSRARLRARPNIQQNKNAEIMEAYTNMDTGDARQFYQPLLMLFNGQKVELT